MPGKPQRTLESSDLVSQGSVNNDNEFEGDIKSDVTDSMEIQFEKEQNEMSEKSEEFKSDKGDKNRKLMDYSKIVDKKTDMLAVEQDLQNQAAEIEKVNGQVKEKENKVAEVKVMSKERKKRLTNKKIWLLKVHHNGTVLKKVNCC
jgi:hypothetical protein